MKYKTFITKSKAGHYWVTICPVGSRWPVFREGYIDNLNFARYVAKRFLDSVEAQSNGN